MPTITIVNDNPSLVVQQLVTEHNALVAALGNSAVSGAVSSINTLNLVV